MKTKILALCLVAATIFAACENEKPVTPSNNKALSVAKVATQVSIILLFLLL